MKRAGNGWAWSDEGNPEMPDPWAPRVHPTFGVLAAHGPEVPSVFFVRFQYPVQTAASYVREAPPLALSSPVTTWISRN
jgi:hypothetical protein